jgi:hypothetical protein
MCHAVAANRICQRSCDWFLADEVGKLLRPVASGNDRIFHGRRWGRVGMGFLFRHSDFNLADE